MTVGKRPLGVLMVLSLFLLMAMLWVAFGSIVAARVHPALPDDPLVRWIISGASFAIAGTLVLFWIFLRRKNRWAYYLSLGLFTLIFLSTFLDDVGWVDLTFAGLCLVVLILMIMDRRWFLGRATPAAR